MNQDKTIELTINRAVGKAIADYKMISDGDKILVGVSGVDSLALLEALLSKQKCAPVQFTLIAVHISLNAGDEKIITDYLNSRNVECRIIKLDLKKGRKNTNKTECFWCSRKKREAIFKLAGRLKCQKVALGHHLDDIIETYLLNIFFLGETAAMPPKLKMRKGNFHIIRPLCYLEKRHIEEYGKLKNIPQMSFECPHSKNTNRLVMRSFIENLAQKYPHIKKNVFGSMSRIKKTYLPQKTV